MMILLLLTQDFEALEKRILDAPSGRCEVRSAEHSGRLLWARGGKARIELKLKTKERDVDVTIVSDGRRWSATNNGETKGPHALEPGFADCLVATLTRPGIVASLLLVVVGNNGPPSKTFPLRDLKPGDPIEYVVSTPASDAGAKTRLWLDAKTGLPAKRELRLGDHAVTETYTVTLDIPVVDADFAVAPEK